MCILKYSKQMLTAAVLSAAVVGGGAFAINASAESSSSSDRVDSLASKIAEKFNVNKDEVKQIIDADREEHMAERRAERQTRLEERLSTAVTNGKITEEQKTKILEYVKSQQTFFDSLKDMTEDERKAAMQKHRDEVKKWASDNGIDEKYVLMGGGPGGHRGGHGGPRGDMNMDDNNNDQTTDSKEDSST